MMTRVALQERYVNQCVCLSDSTCTKVSLLTQTYLVPTTIYTMTSCSRLSHLIDFVCPYINLLLEVVNIAVR